MGERVIPAVAEKRWLVCDRCRADQEETPNDFTDRASVRAEWDEHDWQGHPVAKGSRDWVLCRNCRSDFLELMKAKR